MTSYEFILDGDDLDFAGKWLDKQDRILINCPRINSLLELDDTLYHEEMHAIIAMAAEPVETTVEEDHNMIRKLSFE